MVWNCIKSVTGTGYGVCYMFRIMISRNGDVMSGDRWFMIECLCSKRCCLVAEIIHNHKVRCNQSVLFASFVFVFLYFEDVFSI